MKMNFNVLFLIDIFFMNFSMNLNDIFFKIMTKFETFKIIDYIKFLIQN